MLKVSQIYPQVVCVPDWQRTGSLGDLPTLWQGVPDTSQNSTRMEQFPEDEFETYS